MLLNEVEFEKLIKEAMNDESNPSDILNAKLKQKIKKKYFIHNSFRGIKTAVACVAVIVTGAVILVNSNDGISNKLSEVPGVGNVAKVMTVNDINKKDIISQDNKVLDTTENNTEDAVENAPYISEIQGHTAQGNNKTKTTNPKSNKTPEKKAQTSIPKTEDFNNKAESNEIAEAPNAVKETMEKAEYSISVARSVDAHNEQGFEILTEETVNDAVFETEESAKLYKKLSDLYGEEYDYKSKISKKIKEQAKERMTLNPQIEYNIGDDFTITGNEEFYINDNNEVVIVFDEGVVAPEDLGKVEFNIGIVDR